MKRFNLFSSPGSPGDSSGIRVTAVRKSPQIAYAMEKDNSSSSYTSSYIESVNAITNKNLGAEGAYTAEPSTWPRVLVSPGSLSPGSLSNRVDPRLYPIKLGVSRFFYSL